LFSDQYLIVLLQAGVRVFGGAKACQVFGIEPCRAMSLEYGELAITLELVDSVEDAIAHINNFGSSHTDSIVTENVETAATFLKQVSLSFAQHIYSLHRST
jgi:gamma-glutamyl phosphate reductase